MVGVIFPSKLGLKAVNIGVNFFALLFNFVSYFLDKVYNITFVKDNLLETESSRGISPVIATIVVIAVAVAISLGVAFWASGLVGTFSRFEKLEVVNSYVTRDVNDYTIVVSYKNSGSSDITLTEIFVSDKPLSQFWSSATVNGSSFTQVSIPAGTDGMLSISFPDVGGVKAFVEGQAIEVKVQSSSGVYYIGTFIIP